MTAPPFLPDRMRVRAAIMERAGGRWRVGTGLLVTGMIDRDLVVYAEQAEATAATVRLADDRDLIAVRS